MADARSERIVNRRVAERALDADALQTAVPVLEARHTDDGIEVEERERRVGRVQVDLPAGDCVLDRERQGIDIHLQADRDRGRRAYSGARAAVSGAFDGFVQPERPAPEVLVAEGIESERLAALLGEIVAPAIVVMASVVAMRIPWTRVGRECPVLLAATDEGCSGKKQYCGSHASLLEHGSSKEWACRLPIRALARRL